MLGRDSHVLVRVRYVGRCAGRRFVRAGEPDLDFLANDPTGVLLEEPIARALVEQFSDLQIVPPGWGRSGDAPGAGVLVEVPGPKSRGPGESPGVVR